MDNNVGYPVLKNLLAGSFYQCWAEYDERSAQQIVDDVIAETRPKEIQEAINELDKIFDVIKNSAPLGNLIGHEIGCNYDPEYDGISDVEWLVELKQKLLKALPIVN